MKKLLTTIALIGLTLAPLALGATIPDPGIGTPAGGGIPGPSFMTWVNIVANTIFALIVIGAIIFMLIAGYNMATSGSDPKKVDSAKQMIFWAVIGILVAGLAYGLVQWLVKKMGGTV